MNAITYNQNNMNIPIYRDGELDKDYMPEGPTIAQKAAEAINNLVEQTKLELRMWSFDMVHRTNYRSIRHELIEQKKREAHIAAIGLVPVSRDTV